MMLPLLNMTKAHGPTEFCIGSSHVQGTPHDLAECGGLTRKAPLLNLGLSNPHPSPNSNPKPKANLTSITNALNQRVFEPESKPNSHSDTLCV